MASVREMVEQKLEGIEESVQELRDELESGDFDTLAQLADQISDQADKLAQKFEALNKSLGDESSGKALDKDESEAKKPKKAND